MRFLFLNLTCSAESRLVLNIAGRDKGGYFHELFLRKKRFLSTRIQRVKIKGTGARKPSSPETEPDFYNFTYLPLMRTPSNNLWSTSVGNMVHSGPNRNVGTGREGSLQHILVYPQLTASLQQQQLAPPPLLNDVPRLLMLQAYQAQVQLDQFRMVAAPMRQNMQALASFQQQQIPVAQAGAEQHPAAFGGLPGFYRGV